MKTLPAAAVHALVDWFEKNAKPYLFRREPSAYSIWILEVMAQQTQIARAEERHRRWLERFPDIRALAAAPVESVLKEWEGLGYYARARNIHRTARLVVEERGAMPETARELESLPGIGSYIAASIASIAHGEAVAAIDANARRILARLCASPLSALRDEEARPYIEDMFRYRSAARVNEALMELGEQICRRQNPACAICPLAPWCRAARAGDAESYTRLAAKQYQKLDLLVYCVLRENEILAEKVPGGELWAGLWRLPYIYASAASADARNAEALGGFAALQARAGLDDLSDSIRALEQRVRHSHTKYRITMYPFMAAAGQTRPLPENMAWHNLCTGSERAFPSAFLKVMALLSQE
ncbi:MAG: NUDIX domain-containing protein [Spirochaetota bacterium]|jgi:A/G-specific adenine glycosylase|nr:NUDIX domain-containing protein [Spirochaetota bacterium]